MFWNKPTKEEEEEKERIEAIGTRFIEGYNEEAFIESNLRYSKIEMECKVSNTTFHDSEFPHKTDIVLKPLTLWESVMNFFKGKSDVKWIRPVVAFPSPVFDFEMIGIRIAGRYDPWTLLDDPQASDVSQRGIGDCCLIAALSVIAERPEILKKIFPRQEISEYGVYEVRLCDSGEWKSFLVDDWFPARRDVLMTSRSTNNDLWVLLLEKTAAKIYGGYKGLHGILTTESFTLLTGFPCHRFFTADHTEDEIWDMISESFGCRDLLVAGTSSKIVPNYRRLSLFPKHAYSVLDVQEFDGHRLIRLRDPMGFSMWDGKWGLLWEGWYQYDIRQLLKLNGYAQKCAVMGEFWIGLDDFLKYFNYVSICRNVPNWHTIQVKTVVGGEIDDRNKAIHITVHEKCQVCFSAYSQFGKEEENRAITLMCIRRCYKNGKVGEVCGVFYLTSATSPFIWLESGNYVVMTMNTGIEKTEGNIVIHSSKPLDAHLRVPLNPTVMVESVQKYIQKWGNAVKLNIPSASIHKCWFSSEAMMILAENRSSDQYFHVNAYYERHGFEYASTRFEMFDSQEDTIPPMSRQICLILLRLKLEKIDLKLDMEYSMSPERFGKYGRRNEMSHIPELVPYNYIHSVLPIGDSDSDSDSDNE